MHQFQALNQKTACVKFKSKTGGLSLQSNSEVFCLDHTGFYFNVWANILKRWKKPSHLKHPDFEFNLRKEKKGGVFGSNGLTFPSGHNLQKLCVSCPFRRVRPLVHLTPVSTFPIPGDSRVYDPYLRPLLTRWVQELKRGGGEREWKKRHSS